MKRQLTKKNIDWSNLGFEYIKTDYRFVAYYKDNTWSEGELIQDEICHLHEGSCCLHYAQECFEGLKAQTTKDGRVLLFRPELNAERMLNTAKYLCMPEVPEALFMKGVIDTVRANYAWIPPYGSGASLYIRPVLMGIGSNLGLRPAASYEFRVFASPVGPYYKSQGLQLISLAVVNFDRAAPQGTGSIKAGANYAGGLLASKKAKSLGANEALYLDAAQRKYLEEAGSANILIATKDGKLITPKSNAILPSITRQSCMTIAAKELNMPTEHRPIALLDEIDQFSEMGACGTAAIISPVGKIYINDTWYKFFHNGEEVGPIITNLYKHLIQIQKGEREDPYQWTLEVAID